MPYPCLSAARLSDATGQQHQHGRQGAGGAGDPHGGELRGGRLTRLAGRAAPAGDRRDDKLRGQATDAASYPSGRPMRRATTWRSLRSGVRRHGNYSCVMVIKCARNIPNI